MRLLFAIALFVNAGLLFSVQPMVGKMVLPVLGGTPAVWNTCMVFFQAALLAGYGLAHLLGTRLAVRRQVVLFPSLQLLVLLALPISLGDSAAAGLPDHQSPVLWLLSVLALGAGLPFVVVATTGPLLQKWFASTDHPSAADPYSLYAASNLGSLVALVSYPLLIEPSFGLAEQARHWVVGYGILAALVLTCALLTWRRWVPAEPVREAPEAPPEPVKSSRRLRWVMLAFVPSSLMLGVTTHLSTDIGSFPFLWIVPLALYLLTFVLVFARRQVVPHRWVSRAAPITAIVLGILLLCESMQPPVGVWIGIHLISFFVLALDCHGELANDRPGAEHLTEFYLWMAVGGVLGGAFNALVAPLVFPRVWEYPLALVLACLLRRGAAASDSRRSRRLDWLLPLAVGGLVAALIVFVRAAALGFNQLTVGLMFGLPSILCYAFVDRPLRFALGIAAVQCAAAVLTADPRIQPLYTERSFFGVLRVAVDRDARLYQLVHGTTVHGRQHVEPRGRAEPLSYYHPSGPVGDVIAAFEPPAAGARVGVIGLGAGALAWYAGPDEEWTFYEIDPAVSRLASDSRYFRYVKECHARKLDVVLGDGRLRLREAQDATYDLLVLDAFSSDSVPVHLLTRESLQLYLAKLRPSGLLVFHISNRFLDLKPVLAGLAADAGLHCRCRDDLRVDPADAGKDPSQWAVMARDAADLRELADSPRWTVPAAPASSGVWRDDFSNLLSIVRWRDARGD
jgi:hypothetical protein